MSTSLNQSLSTSTNDKTDRHVRLMLFGSCVTIAAATLVGGLYSLLFLLRSCRKNPLCVIVASMCVDDLLSVVPLSMFLLLQWETDGAGDGDDGDDGGGRSSSSSLCTLSGLLHVFQGVSSNMKACLIAAYTFYVSRRFRVFGSVRRPVCAVMCAVVGVWSVSLSVSVLPLCGSWATFAPLTLGCFPESGGVYVLLLFSLYSLSFCGLLVFFVPLAHELLCSTEPSCVDTRRRARASAPLSRDNIVKSVGAYNDLSPSSCATEDSCLSPDCVRGQRAEDSGQWAAVVGDTQLLFVQKRFSMILALLRVMLWMPMMTLVVVHHHHHDHHTVKTPSVFSVETLSFFLTLLAPVITPLFLLSRHWILLPCGEQDPHQQSSGSVMKRRLDFSQLCDHSVCLQKSDCYTILHSPQHGSALTPGLDFSTTVSVLCPPHGHDGHEDDFCCVHVFPPHQQEHEDTVTDMSSVFDGQDRRLSHHEDTVTDMSSVFDGQDRRLSHHEDTVTDMSSVFDGQDRRLSHHEDTVTDMSSVFDGQDRRLSHHEDTVTDMSSVFDGQDRRLSHHEDTVTDMSSVFDGQDRRLSHHEDCGNMELTDWEWCRSKSQRTSRQRSSGGLSVPLSVFRGTVSLSLSTYEVSSDGLCPNSSKKVEVYRSKSVGHEPRADDPPGNQLDTNVKIHLEVLEICDNEEAMDSVSIISNISQSSTRARSPSLRYSRKENRFISCDLAESASYSLLIPTSGHPEAETMNISIPDTVEAHRHNSQRQTLTHEGHHEEIQAINEVYQRQSEERKE